MIESSKAQWGTKAKIREDLLLKALKESLPLITPEEMNNLYTHILLIFLLAVIIHQKHLVVYWHSKNKNATDMHRNHCKYFPYEKISYSAITDWIKRINRGEDIFKRKNGSGRISDLQIDQRILNALNEIPFHSIRTLSNQLKIPKNTVFNHMRSMGFIIKHLGFVPHTLNDSQKVQRVNYSKQLLDILKQARYQSWAFFLTGDESWLYFINDFEQ